MSPRSSVMVDDRRDYELTDEEFGRYWQCRDSDASVDGGEEVLSAVSFMGSLWRRSRKALVVGSAVSAVAAGCGVRGLWMLSRITTEADGLSPVDLRASGDFWDKGQGVWSYDLDQLDEDGWAALFREFYYRFGRGDEYTVGSPEYYQRMKVFRLNSQYIREYNEKRGGEDPGVTLAPNQFMDMSWPEFRSRELQVGLVDSTWHGSSNTVDRVDGSRVLGSVNNGTLPETFNWIDRGCVTAVKNQKHCGSCWAFAATGALEGALCAAKKQLVSLSEQQLVDCSRREGTMGCNGGFMDNAFQYVIDNGGLCTEDEYPYEGLDDLQCRSSVCSGDKQPAVRIRGIMDLPPHSDVAIRAALNFYGPVAVAVEADRPIFQFYHKGVLNVKCGKHLNHAVLLVGYDTDAETGERFWLIKNSWGPEWGDQGYVRLSRDHHKMNGECGLLIAPVVPIIDS